MQSIQSYINEAIVKGHLSKAKSNIETVDLDLPSGTRWATCNIGTDKPEDDGLLFQFGRTDGYKYGDTNHGFLSKDDYKTTSGAEYKKGDTLKPEDDAAYQATNGILRMPTKEEIDELIKYTNNEWAELNGVKGRKFISKKNEYKWIFIPAAGYFFGDDSSFFGADSYGTVWSATCYLFSLAYNLRFGSGYCYRKYYGRYCGFSVRGVLNK